MRPTVQFEGSAYCNAHCSFCPQQEMRRPRGRMAVELVRKLLAEGRAMGVRRYIPFLNGEPFTDPSIFDWLDMIAATGATTALFTNASRLSRARVERLICYRNIEYVNCSVNAATAETYRRVTGRDDFEQVRANVAYLIERAPFRVKVGMTKVAGSAAERRQFVQQWPGHAKVGDFVNWGGQRHDAAECAGARVACYQLMTKLTVLWQGQVVLCCFDYEGRVQLGDANREPLAVIWQRAEALRQRHLQGDFDMPLCRDCNANARKERPVRA